MTRTWLRVRQAAIMCSMMFGVARDLARRGPLEVDGSSRFPRRGHGVLSLTESAAGLSGPSADAFADLRYRRLLMQALFMELDDRCT